MAETKSPGRPQVSRWKSLADAMQAAGYTDQTLGGKLGIASGTVADWRYGARTPSAKTLARIAAELQVSPQVLLADIPENCLAPLPTN